jgi:hypothetical protein
MSEAHKRRGTIPPGILGPVWEREENALLGTMPDKEVAKRVGRSATAVHAHRRSLGIRSYYKRKPQSEPVKWTPAKDKLLGTMPDSKVARRLGCSPMAVFYRRRKLRIPRHYGSLNRLEASEKTS